MSLISRPVKRFFAFGCSFTNYHWAMWPDIIKQELGDVELYNLGLCGAGNQYIAHTLFLADKIHNFTKDDLIIPCWSSAFRNDWFIWGDYTCEGNAFWPGPYGELMPIQLQDLNHYTIRDARTITSVTQFLENHDCQNHQLCMINNFVNDDQDHGVIEQEILDHPECKPYIDYLEDKIKPSFWDTGQKLNFVRDYWDAKGISLKDKDPEGNGFVDDHPLPENTLKYLTEVLEHDFSQKTKDIVFAYNEKLCDILRNRPEEHYQNPYIYMYENYPEMKNLVNFLD